ncbi:uncharacterized protein LAESUDRAFT_754304 [Laetiporus sulphureus 93-53]|uniref:Peptidase A2 domain-containing protein n=1 Tax=Laetiporus sulphureus 93-53 TaxID=1314785 RepID=A0A165HHN3_9APHY|nr:uncharacterized protein LAESUDRAFT_754304 [Laetiporus sulphureus 93-53]KZT11745.1 hypothetical protein LAESUDRAFT_754304 [Laetiporus sulphureus 93-53]
MQGYTSGMVQSHKPHVKIAEPPHYSGKGSLEDWLQQLGTWMRWNEINDDKHKITTALLHLEGGAFTYMSEYATKAAARQSLSTSDDFVDVLKVNYRTLDPDKDAQQHLKGLCAKTYPTMVSFTETFHQWAIKTNLGHTALIGYIAEHRDKNVRQAMVTRDSLGIADPTTWPEYLDLCLQLESKFRADKAGQRGTTMASLAPRALKDPNAMVMDRVSTLTKEQEGWLEKKFSDDGKVREEAVHAFIASYDMKGKEKEAEPEPAVEAARITGEEDDEDLFQQGVREVQTEALLDSGAYSCYINPWLVDQLNFATISLEKEIRVYNADASHNKGGTIKKRVLLSHKDVILGMSFLKEHNPEVDWRKLTVNFTQCPHRCAPSQVAVQKEDLEDTNILHIEDLMEFVGSQELGDNWDDMDSFNRWMSLSEDPDAQAVVSLIMDLDTKRNQDRAPQNGEQDKDYWSAYVPKHFHEYGDVFSKKQSE